MIVRHSQQAVLIQFTESMGCKLIIEFTKHFDIDITLFSHEAIIPVKQLSTHFINNTYIDVLLFNIFERGEYNISIRGRDCNVKSILD